LHWAAQTQDARIVQILLDFGANPNAQDFEGASPLHIAGDGNSAEIVAMLLARGANPSLRNNFGTKAADICINRGLGEALRPPAPEPQRPEATVPV
jgi:ankyrin repeat protein